MLLIERYVHAVGKHLPAKSRGDIQEELHSLILDSLEARSGKGDHSYSDEEIAEVLLEFGSP